MNPCWVRVKSTREPAPAMSAGRQRDVRRSALRTWSADDLADPRTADPAQVSLRRDRMRAADDCSPSQQGELHDMTDGSMARAFRLNTLPARAPRKEVRLKPAASTRLNATYALRHHTDTTPPHAQCRAMSAGRHSEVPRSESGTGNRRRTRGLRLKPDTTSRHARCRDVGRQTAATPNPKPSAQATFSPARSVRLQADPASPAEAGHYVGRERPGSAVVGR